MTPALHQQIAEHAYFIWLNDGMPHGFADAHWATAEQTIALQGATPDQTSRKAKKARPARTAVAAAKPEKAKTRVAKAAVAKLATDRARRAATPLHS